MNITDIFEMSDINQMWYENIYNFMGGQVSGTATTFVV